ncbi:secreted protein [Motilibacter rhizosphaerae]|uniref:Secreted protein n=1 Tax=Motilibacter rhizosphaerae TaxID=598652 RepID=A0A4Q7NR59_9ACTN|nr:polysaccharide deacetylase family protein [Motilibacter rhizosphaerae]RZS89455.1 secreted protein [Motilibacter rhizosphaerae]
MNRRDFLVGLGSSGAGVAAGAVGGYEGERYDPAVRHARDLASQAAFESTAHLGTARLIWSVPTEQDVVALTFDDGPHPSFTPRVLQALADAGMRATFNVMGWAALRYPELLRQTVAAGHEIGNHTWTHEDFAFTDLEATREQMLRGKDAIEQVTQVPLRFLRPPRGDINGAALHLAAELGYDVLLWSVARGPGDGPGTGSQVADHVLHDVRRGDVIAFHDGIGRGTFAPHSSLARGLVARREVEIRVLPQILSGLTARGLRAVTVSELLAVELPRVPRQRGASSG